MKKVIVVGAADVIDSVLQAVWNQEKKNKDNGKNCIVIAADGGNDHLRRNQINADYRIGDWDSAKDKPSVNDRNTIVLPVQKDDTDLLAAIRLGMENGGKEFHLFGALGGDRVDHSFASVQSLLFLMKHDCDGYIYHNHSIITLMQNEQIVFSDRMQGYFSVLAVSEKVGHVTIKNAAYEVENASFSNDYPVGVSNEFIGQKTTITAKEGILAIIYPQCDAEPIHRMKFQS